MTTQRNPVTIAQAAQAIDVLARFLLQKRAQEPELPEDLPFIRSQTADQLLGWWDLEVRASGNDEEDNDEDD
jgi:hypothetical protein